MHHQIVSARGCDIRTMVATPELDTYDSIAPLYQIYRTVGHVVHALKSMCTIALVS